MVRTKRNTVPKQKNDKLRSARIQRGWSRKAIAEKLGVDVFTYSDWERGKHKPYPCHIKELCNLFNKSPEELDLVKQDVDKDTHQNDYRPSSLFEAIHGNFPYKGLRRVPEGEIDIVRDLTPYPPPKSRKPIVRNY